MSVDIPDWYSKGEVLAEWKTKVIHSVVDEPDLVIMENNDNVSAWDGARMEVWEWKADLSTTITSNVFEYLNAQGIRTHFKEQTASNEILVEKCNMVPVECVFRFVATWSYIKREQAMKGDDAMEDGTVLGTPIIELYYKNDVVLRDGTVISDPMMLVEDGIPVLDDEGGLILLSPKTGERLDFVKVKEPWEGGERIPMEDFRIESHNIRTMAADLMEQTEVVGKWIKDMYSHVWINTFDWKVEFWLNQKEELVLADVIDGDSCRLRIPITVLGSDWKTYLAWDFLPVELEWLWGKDVSFFEWLEPLPEWVSVKKVLMAEWLDKQWFREWESVDATVRKYQRLADMSWKALSKAWVEPAEKVVEDTSEEVDELLAR